ncbi:MAG TPA: serine protein kinase RIO [Candidatus Syntrophoarchaeum butanivorans]|uniref:non-specific serine/threonine protein kinase n=1 Tax=Candidatus Syntropharchaeum butanivorans TaxID=1839936 RepID=A0A1F2P540_9EURY|nr:MAG: serine/threonine protein kinase involved in cell cycle control [Candidatus Syntrophoarchaeum butanivorans]HEC57879.1 serine protein kinase RIO [Candidatus Syntrophoarchaeum butanivorans]
MTDKIFRKIEEELARLHMKERGVEDLKVEEDVFDKPTLEALYRLANKGLITAMDGAISTGKEANVFYALGENDRKVAIKIYRITTSNFKAMSDYLLGDPRFQNIRHTKKSIVFEWTKKEFKNLMRAYEVGVRVPEPIVAERNILIMEFIGEDEVSAPRLKDVGEYLEDPGSFFEIVVEYTSKLYQKASLVHADLSEFNILVEGGVEENARPVFIDIGQGVTLDHVNAEEFLRRDIQNICRYFKKIGVECDEEDILRRVRGE